MQLPVSEDVMEPSVINALEAACAASRDFRCAWRLVCVLCAWLSRSRLELSRPWNWLAVAVRSMACREQQRTAFVTYAIEGADKDLLSACAQCGTALSEDALLALLLAYARRDGDDLDADMCD
jgi:hypothetical protein